MGSGTSILGLGLDLVEIERIQRAVERHGAAFLDRVFTPAEQETYRGNYARLAARWAAKEAVAKAFGTGLGAAMNWNEIGVVSAANGAPFVVLTGAAAETARTRGVHKILITLTHTLTTAGASVILLGDEIR